MPESFLGGPDPSRSTPQQAVPVGPLTRAPWVKRIVLLLVTVVVVAVGAGVLLLRDDGESPQDVVRAYYAARKEGDCAAAITYLTEKAWSLGGGNTREEWLDHCRASFTDPEVPTGAGLTVNDVEEHARHGDCVVLWLHVSVRGNPDIWEATLVRRDNLWRIHHTFVSPRTDDESEDSIGSGIPSPCPDAP